jgi:two-component system, LytTR family, sensor histidine kinase AlgZ
MAASASDTRGPSSTLFLPNFCESRAVLAVVLIVELVALMFAISRHTLHASFWLDLAGSSLFLLWIGLTCAAVLCRARAWLHTLPAIRASLIAMALMLACVGVISEIVFQIGRWWSNGVPGVNLAFPTDHGGFMLRSLGVGFIVSALALRYFYVSAEWKRVVEMEALARIRALQARIRPHFLFNSMNTIAALTRSSPERAEQAVEDLADLFRASLSDANARISLKDEIEIARTHERIEQLRLRDRLRVHWDVDELPMRVEVPSLILQPLLENAVYHGIEPSSEPGVVSINVFLSRGEVHMILRNPYRKDGGRHHSGNKMALGNVKERLALHFDAEASLESRVTKDGYEVHIRLPYRTSAHPDVARAEQRATDAPPRAKRSGTDLRASNLLGRLLAHA